MLENYIENICFFLILTTVVFNIFPNEQYTKYIKLITGFILVLIVLSPLLEEGADIDFSNVDIAIEYEDETMHEMIEEYESVIEDRIANVNENLK